MDFTNDQKRQIEHLATNTPNLKNRKGHGIMHGKAKKGYYILKDNRVIKLADIGYNDHGNKVRDDYAAIAARHPELKNLSGLGKNPDTDEAKPGFYLAEDGRYLSIKQLMEADKADAKEPTEQ